MRKTTKLSNTGTAKQALMLEFTNLGGAYLRGTTAIADMLKLVAVNAAESLISEPDAPAVVDAWLKGSGPMGDKTIAKMRSQLVVIIKAAALPRVEFVKTMDKAAAMHAEKAKTKHKPAQLTELYLGLAREQVKNDQSALSKTVIESKLVAPKSRQSGAEKPAAGVRMAKQVKNLSPADFKVLVAAVHARLGIQNGDDAETEDEADGNPIERMIAMAGSGAPLLRAADAPRGTTTAHLLQLKKRRARK
jgi:hypothetical protein